MCGIVGYVGPRDVHEVILSGLRALEYRGYEGAGAALVCSDGSVIVEKALKTKKGIGASDTLRPLLLGHRDRRFVGAIAHTRWPTHGANTTANAHPHQDCTGTVYVVHNGTLYNFRKLERELHGHTRRSETDTELIAHLIEREYTPEIPLEKAVRRALEYVQGTYGLAVVSTREPGRIVCARMGSPLRIGLSKGEVQEAFVASDEAGIVAWTDRIVDLHDGDIAVISANGLEGVRRRVRVSNWSVEEAQKGGYPYFMAKEISEQAETVAAALNFGGRLDLDEGDARLGGLEAVRSKLRGANDIALVACGTAYHAGLLGSLMLSEWAGVPHTCVYQASELYGDGLQVVPGRTLAIAISQSGETRDTLNAIAEVRRRDALTLGVVNRVGSELAQLCGQGVYCNAGPEISVASTKAFVSQLTVLALITLFFGRMRGRSRDEGQVLVRALQDLPDQMKEALSVDAQVRTIAHALQSATHFLFTGRRWHLPVALEGALKLKEITYLPAEGCPAGEMKHGPLALLDETFPTVALIPRDATFEPMLGNLMEARRTGSPTVVVTTPDGMEDLKGLTTHLLTVPQAGHPMLQPLLSVVPLQLLAYHLAVKLGRDVDQPRNLAKSVTVE